MRKFILLLLCAFLFTAPFAQQKMWKIVVYTATGKIKGRLADVTDSSVFVQTRKGGENLSYAVINRFKFVRTDDKGAERLLGAVAGAAIGAGVAAGVMTKGRDGEPRALAGVVGGIGGGIAGLLLGVFTGPVLHNAFSAKKIKVLHTPAFYRSLPPLLRGYLSWGARP